MQAFLLPHRQQETQHVSSASNHASGQTSCCGQRSRSDYHLVWQIFLQDQISREYSWTRQTTTIVKHLCSSAGKRSSLAITSTGGTQGLQGRTHAASSPCPVLSKAQPYTGFSHEGLSALFTLVIPGFLVFSNRPCFSTGGRATEALKSFCSQER